MFIDSNNKSLGSIFDEFFDICIIGTGPSGSILLEQLSKDKNKSICVIESGDFKIKNEHIKLNEGQNPFLGNYPHENYSTNYGRLRQIGGTSNVWAGWSSPLNKFDFEKRHWIENSGWPITYDEFNKYFLKANDYLKLAEYEYFDTLLNFIKNNNHNHIDNFLVHYWQFYKEPLNFRKKILNKFEKYKNVKIFYNLNCNELILDNDLKTIQNINCSNFNNEQIQIKSKIFVLCCGGIENASLLLNSNTQESNGIGNRNSLVGKYFMEHPHITISKNHVSAKKYFKNFEKMNIANKPEVSRLAGLVLNYEIQEKESINNAITVFSNHNLLEVSSAVIARYSFVSKVFPIKFLSYIKKLINETPFAILDLFNLIKFKLDNNFNNYSIIRIEQEPTVSNRVELSQNKNIFNKNIPILKWTLNSRDKKTIDVNERYLSSYLLKNNIVDRIEKHQSDIIFGVGHHMGTTRMSYSDKDGVVNSDHKVFGYNNLYINGSSVFPTSGSVNPTLTILALSFRLSEILDKRMKD